MLCHHVDLLLDKLPHLITNIVQVWLSHLLTIIMVPEQLAVLFESNITVAAWHGSATGRSFELRSIGHAL